MVDASATFPKPFASPVHHISALIDEFCSLYLFEGMLITSTVFIVAFVLFQMMPMADTSESL